jgi:hypothetical protein
MRLFRIDSSRGGRLMRLAAEMKATPIGWIIQISKENGWVCLLDFFNSASLTTALVIYAFHWTSMIHS